MANSGMGNVFACRLPFECVLEALSRDTPSAGRLYRQNPQTAKYTKLYILLCVFDPPK
jgi:hypothetical protein